MLSRGILYRQSGCNVVPSDAFQIKACHTVYARYVKPLGARIAILYSHGKGETLSNRVEFHNELAKRLNAAVLAYEYCGYGCSDGEPNQKCILQSGQAAFDWLRKRWPTKNIVVWGNSVGSAPTSRIASQNSLACIVIESGFTSTFEVVKDHAGALQPIMDLLAVPLIAFTPLGLFNNMEWLQQSKAPLLVLHGTLDQNIDQRHAQLLAGHLDGTLELFEAGHSDLHSSPGYWNAVQSWFSKLPNHVPSYMIPYQPSYSRFSFYDQMLRSRAHQEPVGYAFH